MRRKLGLVAALGFAAASAAQAADLPTTKPAPPPPVPAAIGTCTDPIQFITTACPLTWYGITVYGTVDMGVGWEQHGTPFNPSIITGVEELVQKNSNRSLWLATPNGLSQSNIGIKGKEEFAPGWSFIFDLNMGFDPYSLRLADGPRSLVENDGIPLNNQTSNADSSRAGQFYNGAGYAGISTTNFGTLTFGRQNSLTLDGVNAYDPMGGSYAFSVVGWSGAMVGVGDTEDARYTTALKYRITEGMFRAAALYQFGGYDLNNGSKNSYQFEAGADVPVVYGTLSLDAIYTKDTDAVSSSALSAAQNKLYPGTLAATISDQTGVTLLAKYTFNQFKISGGYEHILFQNPSNPQLTSFTDIGGYTVVAADITNTTYNLKDKILQIMFIGGRYAFTDSIDAGVAYYHYIQNSYYKTYCDNESQGSCAGTLDAVSFDADWKFAAKFDVYAGIMFSQVHNGLANGYIHSANVAPSAGLRFRF
jgi:predicted porin